MAAISKSTLFSNAWADIFSVVNNRSNIRNPADINGTRKFIYARLPNVKNDIEFPFIVINQPKIITQNRPSTNAQRKNIMYACEIEVYTKDSASGTASLGIPNGQAQRQLNQIADDIYKTFNNNIVRQGLKDNRIENVNLVTNDMTYDMDLQENIVFTGNFTLTFNNKKDVF